MIVIMTRWHEDDLVGRILASDDAPNWTVLTLPALAEPNDPLGRPEGAALCPERFDEKALADIRLVMGEYAFGALYQQRPSPRTGNMFPRDKVEIIDAIPAGATKRVRYWDKAGTKDGGKYSAGVRMSYIPMGTLVGQGTIIVEDVVRGQWAADARNAVMQQTAKMDHGCPQKVEQEPGSGGKESAEFSVKLLAGSSVSVDRVTGDKVTRADPLSSQWKVGNVKLLRGDWNKAYLDEMEKAPNGTFVDQMDSSSGAFNHLVLGATPRVRSLS
jgi:predicted phage terminase large subunit-like protein